MRAAVSKCLNGVTLLGVGGVLLSFWLNHRLDQYLHPQFRPGVLGAGLLLVAIGTVYCLTKASRQCCIDGVCVHENNASPGRSVTAFGVLLVPLVLGTFASKDAFDEKAVLNREGGQGTAVLAARSVSDQAAPIPSALLGGDSDETASSAAADPNQPGVAEEAEGAGFLPRSAAGNVALEVTDLLYSESEASLRKMFAGRTVEVVGQYLPSRGNERFKLVRMLIVCCAADARPMVVNVETAKPAGQADMAWVKVIGTPVYTDQDGKTRVTVKAREVLPADPPADAMLY
ncbi:MAG TPA: hypothetical protein VGD78_02585 [Chthoniobacterales bacterium]